MGFSASRHAAAFVIPTLVCCIHVCKYFCRSIYLYITSTIQLTCVCQYVCAGAGDGAVVGVGADVCVGVNGLLQSDNNVGVG